MSPTIFCCLPPRAKNSRAQHLLAAEKVESYDSLPTAMHYKDEPSDDTTTTETLSKDKVPGKLAYFEEFPDSLLERPQIGWTDMALCEEMLQADHADADLLDALRGKVSMAGGWNSHEAFFVLKRLGHMLFCNDTRDPCHCGRELGPAISRAFARALSVAKGMDEFEGMLPAEWDGLDATWGDSTLPEMITLGTLYLMWPTITDVLGFRNLGPLHGELSFVNLFHDFADNHDFADIQYAGSFAADWQELYTDITIEVVYYYLQCLNRDVSWEVYRLNTGVLMLSPAEE